MEDLPKIIIAGKPQFTAAVKDVLTEIKTRVLEVYPVTDTGKVADTLRQKRDHYTHLILEDTFFKYHGEDHIVYSRELCPALKVILCREKHVPISSRADAVITGTINKEKIELVINSHAFAASEKKIQLALRAGFTIRELQVFNGIAEGISNKEMAKRYFLSIRTIETHREKLKEKAGAKNLIQLMFFGYRKKWVDKYGNKLLNDEILKQLLAKNPIED